MIGGRNSKDYTHITYLLYREEAVDHYCPFINAGENLKFWRCGGTTEELQLFLTSFGSLNGPASMDCEGNYQVGRSSKLTCVSK